MISYSAADLLNDDRFTQEEKLGIYRGHMDYFDSPEAIERDKLVADWYFWASIALMGRATKIRNFVKERLGSDDKKNK